MPNGLGRRSVFSRPLLCWGLTPRRRPAPSHDLLDCSPIRSASPRPRLALSACDPGEPLATFGDASPDAATADLKAPPAPSFTVEEAPEWSALFDRDSGWSGADGIWSIPLSGNDAPGSASGDQTAFFFSDTFVGDVRPDGTRKPGSTLVNNSLALLTGGSPEARRMQFVVQKQGGQPTAMFVPQSPDAQPGDWLWPQDHFVNRDLGNAICGTSLRVRSNGGDGAFGFEIAGITMMRLPAGSRPPFPGQQQDDLPFYRPASGGRGEILLGAGLFVNTDWAGAPEPDGYVYVYGTENLPFTKNLVVARVRPADFFTYAAWRFYDGSGWTSDFDRIAPIAERVSSELSVSPIPGGGYALIFQLDTLSPIGRRTLRRHAGRSVLQHRQPVPGARGEHQPQRVRLQREGASQHLGARHAAGELQRQHDGLRRALRQRRHLPAALHPHPLRRRRSGGRALTRAPLYASGATARGAPG